MTTTTATIPAQWLRAMQRAEAAKLKAFRINTTTYTVRSISHPPAGQRAGTGSRERLPGEEPDIPGRGGSVMNETQTEEQAVAWLIEQAPQAVHILPISRIKPRANGQVTAHIMVGEFTTKESRHVRPDSLYTSREAAATAALAMLADKREQINRILDRSEAVLRKMLEELA